MNILLCVIHALDNKNTALPTGAAFISAVLKQKSYNVHNFVWDISHDNSYNVKRLKEQLIKSSIDVVMCGGVILNYQTLKVFFKTAKSISSSLIAIQGGCLVSYSPNEAMELIPECDIGVIGEGEITICELMNALENKKDIDTVKGIIYRDKNKLRYTEKRNDKPDLAALPMPDHEGFFGEFLTGHNGFLITSGRGCDFSCTFCTKLENRYRERPIVKFFEELDYYVQKYHINKIIVLNEFFSIEEEYLDIFCKKIKKYNLPIQLQTRISHKLTLDVLIKMKDAGVIGIYFGLESADNVVLKSMKKGLTIELMKRVLSEVKTARIKVEGNFIFGDTVENHETISKTFEFVKTHRDLFNNLSFNMIRLYPGSSLYDKAIAEGKIEPFEHIKKQCPPVNVSMLSDEEYAYYRDYYLNYFFVTQIDIDVNIKNVTFSQIAGTECIFRFECVSCEKKHEIKVSLKNMAQPDVQLFCDCGEKLMLDLYHHLIDKDKIIQIIKNHKTAFYGIGCVFYKCFFKCDLSELRDKFILVNSSERSTNPAGDTTMTIFPPEAINEFNIEKVIVTLSGYFDVETILADLKKRFPCADFVMWYVSDSTLSTSI